MDNPIGQAFSRDELRSMLTKSRGTGVLLGVFDESDVPEELTVKYRNRKARIMRN